MVDCDILLIGTACGYLCVWRKLRGVSRYLLSPVHAHLAPQDGRFRSISSHCIGDHKEVTSIDAFKGSVGTSLVATASLDGCVQLWEIGANAKLWCTVAMSLSMDDLRSVRFSPDGENLRAFGLYEGKVWVFFSLLN